VIDGGYIQGIVAKRKLMTKKCWEYRFYGFLDIESKLIHGKTLKCSKKD
jgi:hypothetical protein